MNITPRMNRWKKTNLLIYLGTYQLTVYVLILFIIKVHVKNHSIVPPHNKIILLPRAPPIHYAPV